jgi:DNA repair photolyase
MRWDNLRLDDSGGTLAADGAAQVPLFERGAVVRTFDTPGFRGMTFYEVQAKSIVSHVPKSSRMSFRWTINPYRGCQHACVYCFARNTHTYLDLDAGADFNSKVVVKVNAPELLRKKLASPGWQGEHIAMGTNVDCYQRAEGRYELMRGIITALRDAANPFSILTKGTLILRDLDLLLEAAEVTDVGLNVSAAFVDKSLWRAIEPGTPAPERRLEACATLNDNGLRCGVLMGPVVPFLSDSPAQLDAAVRRIAEAGAPRVSAIVLHLRPGTREWFLGWLRTAHPELVGRYEQMYRRSAYAPKEYQARISSQVQELAEKYGVGRTTPREARAIRSPAGVPDGSGATPAAAGRHDGSGASAAADRSLAPDSASITPASGASPVSAPDSPSPDPSRPTGHEQLTLL